MNGFAAVLVLLGVLWTQTSALETFALHDPINEYVTGTMTIHNDNQVVEVHVRSGQLSSDTIFDYSKGYIATRLFSRNACFILKIDKDYIPELQEIGRLAFERKAKFSRRRMEVSPGDELSSGLRVAHILPINRTYYNSKTAHFCGVGRTMKEIYSPYNVWVQFQSGHSLLGGLIDWFRYGSYIKQLCSGLPLYKLEKTQRPLDPSVCVNSGIPSLLGIHICENVV